MCASGFVSLWCRDVLLVTIDTPRKKKGGGGRFSIGSFRAVASLHIEELFSCSRPSDDVRVRSASFQENVSAGIVSIQICLEFLCDLAMVLWFGAAQLDAPRWCLWFNQFSYVSNGFPRCIIAKLSPLFDLVHCFCSYGSATTCLLYTSDAADE